MNNPINIIKMMMGKISPKDMANKGDIKGVENFARNVMKEKGMDYDTEFNKFKDNFK